MRIRELEVISELVNYKSYFDASFSLLCTPSIISKYVTNVEEELGVRLFVRSSKTSDLMLTSEGKALINSIQKITKEYKYMTELAHQLKYTHENVMRIGLQPRYGNIHEQQIIASFMYGNPDVKVEIVKMGPRNLMNLLQSGQLDAYFATLHEDIVPEEYFRDEIGNSDIEIVYLLSERENYLGISEEYLPGKTEAPFREFKDFTFVFPFPDTPDNQDVKAVSTFETLAKENGFKLKKMHFSGNDNTIFQLAKMLPLAVSTLNIPAQYDGIKFVKTTDWKGCSNQYFIYRKSNKKKTMSDLKKCVNQFLIQLGRGDK